MKFAKVRDVKSPVRGTEKSAGIDFFVPNDFNQIKLFPQTDLLIPSGIKANVPEGYMLMAAEKSGVVTSVDALIRANRPAKPGAYNTIVTVGAKIVDQDYQGEIHIHLVNVGHEPVLIKPGTKIAQFILVPVSYAQLEEVAEAVLFTETTSRGDGGFGLGTGVD
jgi:dUTP pyrophosphatase